MPERLKTGRRVAGVSQTRRAIRADEVECVYIAEDADSVVTGSIVQLCRERELELVSDVTMKRLGELCGLNVGAAAVALLKAN